MPVRTLSEQYPVSFVMRNLASVMEENTNFALANGTVLINDRSPLLSGTARWPALLLSEGERVTSRLYWTLWQYKLTIMASYLQRYDQSTSTLDALWESLNNDLSLMVANVQDNPTLTVGGVQAALSVQKISFSPYVGSVNSKEYPIPVVERVVSFVITVPPYVTAG